VVDVATQAVAAARSRSQYRLSLTYAVFFNSMLRNQPRETCLADASQWWADDEIVERGKQRVTDFEGHGRAQCSTRGVDSVKSEYRRL